MITVGILREILNKYQDATGVQIHYDTKSRKYNFVCYYKDLANTVHIILPKQERPSGDWWKVEAEKIIENLQP